MPPKKKLHQDPSSLLPVEPDSHEAGLMAILHQLLQGQQRMEQRLTQLEVAVSTLLTNARGSDHEDGEEDDDELHLGGEMKKKKPQGKKSKITDKDKKKVTTTNDAPSEAERFWQDQTLDVEVSKDLQERESLERRLEDRMQEREYDALSTTEKRERIGVYKDNLEAARLKLVDRATYSSSEVHRTAARVALQNLNNVITDPLVSLEEMNNARRQAQEAIKVTDSAGGEEERVELMSAAMTLEKQRKARVIEDIKDALQIIESQLRIPDTLLGRAEELASRAHSLIILAMSVSRQELQTCLSDMNEFIVSASPPPPQKKSSLTNIDF